MGWWMVAAAAAPYVMSAMQKKPKAPGAPGAVQMPDRSQYINGMLDTAYNPNSEQWGMAADRAADQVNRILGRQGMAGSSVGMQAHQAAQAQIAQAWLADQAQRQAQAMQIVNQYDTGRGNLAAGQAAQQYNYANDAYNRANQANAAQVQGISNMVGAGMQMYNQHQADQRWDQMMEQNQQILNNQQAFYGTPGSAPNNYTSPEYQYGQQPMPYGRVRGGGF